MRLPYPKMTHLGRLVLAGLIVLTIWLGLRMYGDFADPIFAASALETWVLEAGPIHQSLKDRQVPMDQLHQVISHSFVHFGWEHLAFNMVPLSVLGWLTMRRSGVRGFLLAYFGGMVLAVFGYVSVVNSFINMGGASGAVHALGGAWVIWAWTDRAGQPWRALPSFLWLGLIIAVNLYLYRSMEGRVAWELHATGVIAGMAMAPLFRARQAIAVPAFGYGDP
ncbi:MAG: rhomboid family intramembrane serine protease [Rhodobacteraceae bacterium]|nr:rhomboid family intramembrane serine protease [Paracoccaceae bacterium]MCF8514824.1 rhomboid family intramembrane serine protease [Paracoccaceae bacterium]